MKHIRLILVALTVVQIIGIVVFIFIAPYKIHDSLTVSVAPGLDSSGHTVVDMMGGGVISGEFGTTSGREVLFMILDQDQYEDYVAGSTYGTHYSEITPSDEFSIDYGAMEWCHFVVQHAVEPDSSEEITVTYTLNTNDWVLAFGGLGLFAAAAFGEAGIMIKRGRDRKAFIGPISTYDDVVIFDELPKK